MIRRFDPDPSKVVVPHLLLVFFHPCEVPAERPGDLFLQVEPGIGDAGHRDGTSYEQGVILLHVEGDKSPHVAASLHLLHIVQDGTIIHTIFFLLYLPGFVGPSPQAFERPAELQHKIEGIVLHHHISCIIAYMVHISFDPPVAGTPDHGLHIAVGIFGRGKSIDQHTCRAGMTEDITLHHRTCGGGKVDMDIIIRQIDTVFSYAGLLRSLVDAGAVAQVGMFFRSGLYLQGACGGHHEKSCHGPFLGMVEPRNVLHLVFIAAFPHPVLVVGSRLHHGQGHARTGGDHPPRAARAHELVYIVRIAHRRSRSPFHLPVVSQLTVHVDLHP